MDADKKVVCTGRTATYIIMGVLIEIMGIGFILLMLCSGAIELADFPVSLISILVGVDIILYWYNTRITITYDEIIYRSNWGKERTYSWQDVKSVRYKPTMKGACRILIQTDKKIYLGGDMTNFEEAEKLLKEKGYLDPLKKY